MFSKSGFSEGYKIKNGKNLTLDKKTKKELDKYSYPNGIVPFIFITIFYIITISCVLGIGFGNLSNLFSNKSVWTNSVISVTILPVLLNFLWMIGRTGFNDVLSFSLLRFSRFAKISKIREKVEFYVHEPAISEVNTLEDFKIFSKNRKKSATKWFYISFVSYLILFTIILVVCLVIQNI